MSTDNGYQEALRRIHEHKKNSIEHLLLDLSFLRLKSIPKEISDLTSLTSLYLSNNELDDIQSLEKLTSLTTLYLSNNKLSDIQSLEKLTSLKTLYLDNNQLNDIQPLVKLTSLTRLYLYNNQINDIQPLEKLTSLTRLYLQKNRIEDLYLTEKAILKSRLSWLKKIPELKLRIDHNPFLENSQKIKNELYSSNRMTNHYEIFVSDLKQAIKSIDGADDDKNSIALPKKMVLLGNSNSGKSTLSDHLLNSKQFAYAKRKSTEVLSIKNWFYAGNKKDFAFIYDFGGQDFYHGTYQMFLSLKSLYVVVWDKKTDYNHIVDASTKQRQQPYINYDLSYWISNIEYLTKELPGIKKLKTELSSEEVKNGSGDDQNNEDSLFVDRSESIVLVENKIDLLPSTTPRKESSVMVNCKEQFRISLEKKSEEVSAIAERRALLIKYLKEELQQLNSEEMFSEIQRRIIQAFLKKREAIIKKENIIQFEKFADAIFDNKHPRWWNDLNAKGFNLQHSELRFALRLLHNRGLLLYFHDVPELKETIFVDPEEVLTSIKKEIIQKANSKSTIGRVTTGKLSEEELQGFDKRLLALSLNQQIVFDNSKSEVPEERYIIPSFLEPSDKSNLLYEFSISRMKPMFSLKFNYFMPYGMMNRVICGFGKEPHRKYFFRNEIIFTLNKEDNIWIKCDPVKLRIDVWSTHSEKKNKNRHIEFIYRILMAAYYRIPTLDYKTYSMIHLLEESGAELALASKSDIRSKDIPVESLEGNYEALRMNSVWKKFQDFERNFYLNKQIYSPQDLLLSVDGDYFISLEHVKEAFDEGKNKSVITAETLDEDEKKYKQLKRHHFNAFMPKDFPQPKKVFVSYAHDDIHYRKELQKYLINLEREDKIEIWQDGQIEPGEDWDAKILSKLKEADWVIMLVSQNFIASNYIYEKELQTALEKVGEKEGTRIIPILIANCDWKNWKALPKGVAKEMQKGNHDLTNVSAFSFLPMNDEHRVQPIKKWQDAEDAWTRIVEKLRDLLK
ncbi:MAG: leucine-rich repeat domain-containing protein [Bacteroidota bacterium]